jgi:hypothetical protein
VDHHDHRGLRGKLGQFAGKTVTVEVKLTSQGVGADRTGIVGHGLKLLLLCFDK